MGTGGKRGHIRKFSMQQFRKKLSRLVEYLHACRDFFWYLPCLNELIPVERIEQNGFRRIIVLASTACLRQR